MTESIYPALIEFRGTRNDRFPTKAMHTEMIQRIYELGGLYIGQTYRNNANRCWVDIRVFFKSQDEYKQALTLLCLEYDNIGVASEEP